jgi:PHD/YefM family antitoxin component YafN of YafNO toxin-antitoxin module
MPIGVVRSRELKRSPSRIKRAAANAPVLITEYGKPAYVMLSIEAYRRLIGNTALPAAIEDLDLHYYLFDEPRAPSESE